MENRNILILSKEEKLSPPFSNLCNVNGMHRCSTRVKSVWRSSQISVSWIDRWWRWWLTHPFPAPAPPGCEAAATSSQSRPPSLRGISLISQRISLRGSEIFLLRTDHHEWLILLEILFSLTTPLSQLFPSILLSRRARISGRGQGRKIVAYCHLCEWYSHRLSPNASSRVELNITLKQWLKLLLCCNKAWSYCIRSGLQKTAKVP